MAALLAAVVVAAGACSYTSPEIEPALPKEAQTSRIFAGDGSLLAALHAEENRRNLSLDEIPDHVQDAVIAIEDERFWRHNGVDIRALLRAGITNASEGEVVQGGSTITQQYVKNALLDTDRTVERKVQEAALAIQMERSHTKERILELYLNSIYFGNGAYGVDAAAHEYFGKTGTELTLAEGATIAGLIRAPSRYDPYDDPDAARRRRNSVLDNMERLGWATPDEVAWVKATPVELAPEKPAEERYPAGHFVEVVKQFILDDPRFGATPAERQALLFTGGLRISTTVDPRLQARAEEAVRATLAPNAGVEGALVAVDPTNGYVRALVGGRDFFGGGAQAKFDLATQGGRQAGSAFKPFVLAAALEEGFDLRRQYDAPPRIDLTLPNGQVWQVDNYGGGGAGRVDLLEATIRSYNTVYAQLILDVGVEDALDTARRLGIRSPLSPFHASVLGTNDVTALDMATAYATLAARGVRHDPVFVTKVTRPDGTILFEHRAEPRRAIEAQVADDVTWALQQVVSRGTGTRAQIGRPAAGKTGTAQEWKDAWFAGYTPNLATAVWVGFPEEQISMAPPRTAIRVTGGSWPAQIWRDFMAPAHDGEPPADFAIPLELPPLPSDLVVEEAPTTSFLTLQDVVGTPVGSARRTLTDAGFVVERRDVASDGGEPGTVVRQEPRAGAVVRHGATVVLFVANGRAASATVPSVVGSELEDAVDALREAGLVPDHVEEPAPAGVPPGVVWKQAPAAGTRLDRGSPVRIWVEPT